MENKNEIKVGDSGYTISGGIVWPVWVIEIQRDYFTGQVERFPTISMYRIRQSLDNFWKTYEQAEQHLKQQQQNEQKEENTMPTIKPYYYCYVYGKTAPKVRHPDYESAEKEAKRLTETHGERVEILKVVATTVVDARVVKAE